MSGSIIRYEFPSCIRGYHVYQERWTPFIGETLSCARETNNRHDQFAVKVMKSGTIVGHLPRKISSTCSLFLRRGGRIDCKVTGARRYSRDLIQGGLEIPCLLLIEGESMVIDKVKQLLVLCDDVSGFVENPPSKKRKTAEVIDVDDCDESDDSESDLDSCWVRHGRFKLTVDEKVIIESGGILNGKHINFAQHLLKSQFPETQGLDSTLLQNRLKLNSHQSVVQILHSRTNHWIVVSNLPAAEADRMMFVYDSIYTDIDEQTKKIIGDIFEEEIEIVVPQSTQKQKGSTDCGVFSIAMATSLLHSQPISFTQSLARSHLISCFQNRQLTPFPQ
uniref:Uncharacterized protein n=1 Tax=Amphimedon queenslandica TaxID=400682 RepID=A0A1X7TR33_AMPQE